MTTLSLASVASMANTAALQALGSELNGYLSSVGLVQTADTGQINWSTVSLPAANTVIGYEIWRFADSSIYFSLAWKTNSAPTSVPVMTLIVGTGSNGSGTITGTVSSTLASTSTSTAFTNTALNYTTYSCCNSDCFWIVWKAGCLNAGNNPIFAFCIEKTCDVSGSPTTTGFCVTYTNTTINSASFPAKNAVRLASPAGVISNSTAFCIVPGNATNSSTASGQKQTYLHQYPIPDTTLSNVVSTIVAGEAPISTQFTSTLVGTTPQNMISMGTQMGVGNNGSAAYTWGLALRWQ